MSEPRNQHQPLTLSFPDTRSRSHKHRKLILGEGIGLMQEPLMFTWCRGILLFIIRKGGLLHDSPSITLPSGATYFSEQFLGLAPEYRREVGMGVRTGPAYIQRVLGIWGHGSLASGKLSWTEVSLGVGVALPPSPAATPMVSAVVTLMAHFHLDRKDFFLFISPEYLLQSVNSFPLAPCSEQREASWSPISI